MQRKPFEPNLNTSKRGSSLLSHVTGKAILFLFYIGKATINVAMNQGICCGLVLCIFHHVSKITIEVDSQVLVSSLFNSKNL